MEQKVDNSHYHRNSFYFLMSLGGIAVLTAIVVGVLVAKRRSQQRFTPVDTVTPEEKHVVNMQNSGYENPTYKYFESYSS